MTDLSFLKTSIQYLKGVGPQLAILFKNLGIETIEDLLYHLPHRYVDRQQLTSLSQLEIGQTVSAKLQLVAFGEVRFGRSPKKLFEAIFTDGKHFLNAKWFRSPAAYFKKKFQKDRWAMVSGKIQAYRQELQVVHPEIEWLEDGELETAEKCVSEILTFYPLTEGLKQRQITKIIRQLLESQSDRLQETLPESLLTQYPLPAFRDVFWQLHFPTELNQLELLNQFRSKAHKRLIFEEFFFLELGLLLKKRGQLEEQASPISIDFFKTQNFIQSLPFQLTQAQQRVIQETLQDLQSTHPMQRLLQGDVGSGKTVVAAACAFAVIQAGYQTCLMAPTEVLAEQHERNLKKWFDPWEISVVLLKSDLPLIEKQQRLQAIAQGSASLVVGTHALIQEAVEFQNLAFAIIDEQHRFGVVQRMKLKAKGQNPHLLIMTATPIPRTLSLTLYGDLEVSILDQLPAGRQPIISRLYSEQELSKLYGFIRQELKAGRQAYFVYPLVEESEKMPLKNAIQMQAHWQQIFPEFRLGLLHGQMKSDEKDAVLKQFLNREIHILIATTVIEVGVDVPNATIMMVEHAERFGLAQLHQLRGRVGRGSEKSYCFFVTSSFRDPATVERLRLLCQTQDGFKIAEADLELRGPGDWMGIRQAGLPDFRVGNLVRDAKILEFARKEAEKWLEKDPNLSTIESQPLKQVLAHRWRGRLNFSQMG